MAGSKIAVLAALVGNFLIAVAKLTAGIFSGSSAMLAEAAHSFSDVGNQGLLLLGIRLSNKPASERHPFGYGKSAYFWPLLVAVLLFGVAGGYSLFEGIEKVIHPHPVDHVPLSLSVLGGAFVIEFFTLAVAVRAARQGARRVGAKDARSFLRQNRDASLLTVLVEDALALAGLPVAAIGIYLTHVTGNGVYDGVASIVIGGLLMGFALFLGHEVHDLLIGRGLSRFDLTRVRSIVDADKDVFELREVQSMHLGPSSVFLGAEVILREGLTGHQTHLALRRLEKELQAALPSLKYVYLEPWGVLEPGGSTAL